MLDPTKIKKKKDIFDGWSILPSVYCRRERIVPNLLCSETTYLSHLFQLYFFHAPPPADVNTTPAPAVQTTKHAEQKIPGNANVQSLKTDGAAQSNSKVESEALLADSGTPNEKNPSQNSKVVSTQNANSGVKSSAKSKTKGSADIGTKDGASSAKGSSTLLHTNTRSSTTDDKQTDVP